MVKFSLILICVVCPMLCSGCGLAAAAGRAIPRHEAPAYSGLPGQSIGIMIWTARGTRADFPSLRIDLANLIQDKLKKSKAEELKGATWPTQPSSIVRYQNDHPEIESAPITDVASKLGVSRLIYIELENFATRSDASLQMFRGSAIATLEIVEITDGQTKIAYTEDNIRATYPPKTPPEGVLNSNDLVMYRGTVDAMADEIVNHLTTHEIEGN